MEIRGVYLNDVIQLKPRRFGDNRGWFGEVYQQDRYKALGISELFVQDNVSFSANAFTVRGLHFQRPPFVQAKLVQVMKGRILDVAVDLRAGSPTYGQHVTAELDADDGCQIYIPGGFAHGFCTLTPNTLVHYKCSAPYSPDHDGGILWHDPALAIPWPTAVDGATVSDKDKRLPLLKELGPVAWAP